MGPFVSLSAAHVAIGAIVNLSTLAKAVIYSLVAGIGLTTAYGAGVTSAAGLLDAVRSRRTVAAIAWGTVALVCAGLVLGGIAAGIFVMTSG
jgi:hypothetical protein